MADEASEPTNLMPFKIIRRGEDTVDEDGEVMFADFSPKVVPADTPDELIDEVVEPAPKDVPAPELVPSSDSTETIEPTKSETTVPAPADEADGKPSPSETGKPDSSSEQKTG